MRAFRVVALLLLFAFAGTASGQDPATDVMFVRVVDTGAGLCCIARLPTGKPADPFAFVVYDAGDWREGAKVVTMRNIRDITAGDDVIDFLVLSHTDADHLGAVKPICDEFKIRRIVHSGYARPNPTATLKAARKAIADEVAADDAIEWNLAADGPLEGRAFQVGKVRMTMVCGFSTPPAEFDTVGTSEFNNAGSIVVRLTYKRKSVLLTGDAVGRHIDDPADALLATERYMVENADDVPVRADVLVAPHHGADNGSATAFIEKVKPVWVIFSAGSDHEHPRLSTVARYKAAGVPEERLLRTDRGDDEPGPKDWPSTFPGGDAIDRDDVDVTITPTSGTQAGTVTVAYRQP